MFSQAMMFRSPAPARARSSMPRARVGAMIFRTLGPTAVVIRLACAMAGTISGPFERMPVTPVTSSLRRSTSSTCTV